MLFEFSIELLPPSSYPPKPAFFLADSMQRIATLLALLVCSARQACLPPPTFPGNHLITVFSPTGPDEILRESSMNILAVRFRVIGRAG